MPPQVSIVITTKNRLDALKRTCRALQKLSPPPSQVLITADGCTDATVDFIKSELSHARLWVNEISIGSVASRDRMIREADGEFFLLLDDDSYPEQPDFIAHLIPIFEQTPALAVIHFPQRTDEYPETISQKDFGSAHLTKSYSDCGAVLRRSRYLELGGYERLFFHAYEEPDYTVRCVAAGYKTLFIPTLSIRHHYVREFRNEMRTHHLHARNEFWSALMRCPFPYFFLLSIYQALSQFRYASTRGLSWVIREPIWWWKALKGIPFCLKKRSPLPWSAYRRWLKLPAK